METAPAVRHRLHVDKGVSAGTLRRGYRGHQPPSRSRHKLAVSSGGRARRVQCPECGGHAVATAAHRRAGSGFPLRTAHDCQSGKSDGPIVTHFIATTQATARNDSDSGCALVASRSLLCLHAGPATKCEHDSSEYYPPCRLTLWAAVSRIAIRAESTACSSHFLGMQTTSASSCPSS